MQAPRVSKHSWRRIMLKKSGKNGMAQVHRKLPTPANGKERGNCQQPKPRNAPGRPCRRKLGCGCCQRGIALATLARWLLCGSTGKRQRGVRVEGCENGGSSSSDSWNSTMAYRIIEGVNGRLTHSSERACIGPCSTGCLYMCRWLPAERNIDMRTAV